MYSIRQATRNISDARLRVRVLPHPRVDKQKRKSHENIFEHIYGFAYGPFYEWTRISPARAVPFHRVK